MSEQNGVGEHGGTDIKAETMAGRQGGDIAAAREHSLTATETEAAIELGLSVKTLRAWRCQRRGPRFVKFGRAVRYLWSDLDEFIRKNTMSTTMSDVWVR